MPRLLAVREQPLLDGPCEDEESKAQESGGPSSEKHAAPHRKTNRRHRPDARSSGQALDDLPAKDDRPRPDEAYAAGDLRGDARGIEDDVLLGQDVREPEDRDYHEQGRSKGH